MTSEIHALSEEFADRMHRAAQYYDDLFVQGLWDLTQLIYVREVHLGILELERQLDESSIRSVYFVISSLTLVAREEYIAGHSREDEQVYSHSMTHPLSETDFHPETYAYRETYAYSATYTHSETEAEAQLQHGTEDLTTLAEDVHAASFADGEDDGWHTDESTESSLRDEGYLASYYTGTEEELEPLVPAQDYEGEYANLSVLIPDYAAQPHSYVAEDDQYSMPAEQNDNTAHTPNASQYTSASGSNFPHFYEVQVSSTGVHSYLPLNVHNGTPLLPTSLSVPAGFPAVPFITEDQAYNFYHTPSNRSSSNGNDEEQESAGRAGR